MNSRPIKVYNVTDTTWFIPFVKTTARKNPIEIRQAFLISRIMISIFTIGLIGYTLDRIMQSLQKPSSLG